MQPSKKFAFDVGITFIASVVTLPLGFICHSNFKKFDHLSDDCNDLRNCNACCCGWHSCGDDGVG